MGPTDTTDAKLDRALWRQICVLDFHAAQAESSMPTIIESRTDRGLFWGTRHENISVNTHEFHARMNGLISKILCYLAKSGRRYLFPDRFNAANRYAILNESEKDREISELKAWLTQDINESELDAKLIVSTCVDLTLRAWKLSVYRKPTPESEESPIRKNYQMIAVDIFDEMAELRKTSQGRWFTQMFVYDIEMRTMMCLLEDLIAFPNGVIARGSWKTAGQVYSRWCKQPHREDDPRWLRVGELYHKTEGIMHQNA